MFVTVLKSKIVRARLTGAELYYEGSLTLDPALMELAGMLPYERVQVVNLNNGQRLETYIIAGKDRGNGEVVLNGPAARLGYVGDEVIILTYAEITPDEVEAHIPTIIRVDEDNRPLEG